MISGAQETGVSKPATREHKLVLNSAGPKPG